jgi:hypothetical protein
LHEIEESEDQMLLSQFDNEICPLGLKDAVPKEEPMTLMCDDPVITISKDAKDATTGTSVENTSEIKDD